MTIYENLSIGISFLAVGTVAVNVILLSRQLSIMARQTAKLSHSLEVSAEASLDVYSGVVTESYMAHPELRPIFHEEETQSRYSEGSRQLSAETVWRANALAESIVDVMERALIFADEGLPKSIAVIRPWVEDSFRNSTFLREWLLAHRCWYADSVVQIAEDVELELRNLREDHEKYSEMLKSDTRE